MSGLGNRDLGAVLSFATQVANGEFTDDVGSRLAALKSLIACDLVEYVTEVRFADESDGVVEAAWFHTYPEISFEVLEGEAAVEQDRADPIRRHRERTGSLAALRLSDVVGDPCSYWRRPEVAALGEHLWAQYGAQLPYLLTVRVARPHGRPSALSFVRDGRDFTPRDMQLLDSLCPFLRLLEALPRRSGPARDEHLTPRECQILDLVAGGSTNREIAQALDISPTTVRTHLEHVFAKLGVSTRTAALAKTGRARGVAPAMSRSSAATN
jgi:DNA-binding CsgD family transcriptional regulator